MACVFTVCVQWQIDGVKARVLIQGVVPASTLDGLQFVSLDDDAELQDQLRSALQEGGQEVQHADVSELVYHPPVEPPAVMVPTAPAPEAQVDGMEIPGIKGNNTSMSQMTVPLRIDPSVLTNSLKLFCYNLRWLAPMSHWAMTPAGKL
jgi:hypothetical protein